MQTSRAAPIGYADQQIKTVIIADPSQPYHKHFIAELCSAQQIHAIVTPLVRRQSRPAPYLSSNQRRLGWLFRLLAKEPGPSLRGSLSRFAPRAWDVTTALALATESLIPDYEERFRLSTRGIPQRSIDFSTASGLATYRALGASVALCSGGPIYSLEMIASTPLVLNVHTGISPIYNGSFTAFWPFADGQPHLSGVTLMLMSPTLDGGPVLAHGLPNIDVNDDPATLFIKSLTLGAKAITRLLQERRTTSLISVEQPSALFRYRGRDWSILQNLRVSLHLSNKICNHHLRPEYLIEYWRSASTEEARSVFYSTLLGLLFGSDVAIEGLR